MTHRSSRRMRGALPDRLRRFLKHRKDAPVVVVAVLTPKEGRLAGLLDAFTQVAPLVQREAGCELYAVHTDGRVCVMVERWSSDSALRAHAGGAAMQRLTTLWGDSLEKPFESWIVRNHPTGNRKIGTVQ